jgi:hypothetical protein
VGGGGFQEPPRRGAFEGFGVISFPQHSLQKSPVLADIPKEGFLPTACGFGFPRKVLLGPCAAQKDI